MPSSGVAGSSPENANRIPSSQTPNTANQNPSQFSPSEASLEIQSYMAPFIYESIKQKDPFEDPTVVIEDNKTSIKAKDQGLVIVPKTPPEEHDLKEISLKGIIWDTSSPKALFELPNNGGYYTLIKGDKIGNNGIIFDIRESEVVIVETRYVGTGKQKREEQVIKIKRINRLASG